MRKLTGILLSAVVVIGLTACGNSGKTTTTTDAAYEVFNYTLEKNI